jgi:hypothetical protein
LRHNTGDLDGNLGIGYGMTNNSDRALAKLIVVRKL